MFRDRIIFDFYLMNGIQMPGIEPGTSYMRSTTELHPLKILNSTSLLSIPEALLNDTANQ